MLATITRVGGYNLATLPIGHILEMLATITRNGGYNLATLPTSHIWRCWLQLHEAVATIWLHFQQAIFGDVGYIKRCLLYDVPKCSQRLDLHTYAILKGS